MPKLQKNTKLHNILNIRFFFLDKMWRHWVLFPKLKKKCGWATQKNLTKEKYRPVSVDEMPCFENKGIYKSQLDVNPDDIVNFFCNKLPASAIAKHM